MDTNDGKPVFKLEAVSIWKSMFGVGTRSIRAYACLHCHHLQLAVNFSDEDLRRYQHFEGKQPSVLGRINSEPKVEGVKRRCPVPASRLISIQL